MGEGCRSGSDAVRPSATRTGRFRAVRAPTAGELNSDDNEKDDRASGRRIMTATS